MFTKTLQFLKAAPLGVALLLILLPLQQVFALPTVNPSTETSNVASALDCRIDKVDKPVYLGEFVSIDTKAQPSEGQSFETTVRIKNTGNMPWFSLKSKCVETPITYLGTTKAQDRISVFFPSNASRQTKWTSGNRIEMSTLRVNPGEIAEFTFTSQAPMAKGIYREYFAPVVEGVAWMKGNAEFKVDFSVGNAELDENQLGYTKYIEESMNLLDTNLIGDKKIVVDISEQKMWLKIGEKTIKTFPISTGTYKTPTPVGTFKVLQKQEVRVAGKTPHYIMPKFMLFKNGGYGIHALPSLANDKGVFWREALNHIGSRRSHGCIRLLPQDAEFAYQFADIGTTVQVVY